LQAHYTTNGIISHHQFEYWRDAICDAYVRLGCESVKSTQAFQGEIVLERLSDLSLSFVSGSPHIVHRRPCDISRSSDAYFLLSLQLENRAVVSQDGHCAVLKPKDFVLYSSIKPYKLEFTEHFDQLVIQIPRSELLSRIPSADLLTGHRVSGSSSLGGMITNHALELARTIHKQDLVVQRYMQDTIIDLVVTGLASIDQSQFELSLPGQQVLLRAKTYIQSNLKDPGLNRRKTADAAGVSIRHLSDLFAKDGDSIAAFIRDCRLNQIANDLRDIRFAHQSISEICFRWGMNNLQHFSKIFRNKYDVSPSHYRGSPQNHL